MNDGGTMMEKTTLSMEDIDQGEAVGASDSGLRQLWKAQVMIGGMRLLVRIGE